MSTKKQFVELMTFLEANKNNKVETILKEVREMTSSKKNNSTILYDDKNKVVAIFCYYHKQWELVKDVEYGKKASSKSGLNTMCKIGTNLWTKQQARAKRAKANLLIQVSEGEVDAKDLKSRLEAIEVDRLRIDSTNMPKGTKELPKLK